MEISIIEIKKVLEKLLDKSISREKASSWAYDLRQLYDDDKLVFFPKESNNLIWESILFIEGIDLQDEPNVYLHNEKDIKDFLHKIELTGDTSI